MRHRRAIQRHPLAKALVEDARRRHLPLAEPQNFASEAGMGIVAELKAKAGADAAVKNF